MEASARRRIFYLIYFGAMAAFIITYFTQSNYRAVKNIRPEVASEPVQTEIEDRKPIEFSKDGYRYKLTPLYNYELNALIVHKLDYTFFSIYKYDSVFPLDICVIWGDNAKNKVYQNKSLSFSQDFRWCWASWTTNEVDFDGTEAANTHLLIKDDNLKSRIKSLNAGDQVHLEGKLVSLEAFNIGKPGKYDPVEFRLESSVSRADSGAGACEVVLVDKIEILKKGNVLSVVIHQLSLLLVIILTIFGIYKFLISIFLPQ